MKRFASTLMLFVGALLALSSCVDYEDVEVVNAGGLEIGGSPPKNLTLSANVQIRNPNGFSITVSTAEAALYIDSTYAGIATLDKGFELPAESDTTYRLSATAHIDSMGLNLVPVMASLMFKKQVRISAHGTVKAHSFIFAKSVDFNEGQVISLRN